MRLANSLAFLILSPLVGGAATNTSRTTSTPINSHSLTESYQFDPRDGWETVVVTDLRYKYRRSPTPSLNVTSADTSGIRSRNALKRPGPPGTIAKRVLASAINSIAKLTSGIIGIGASESVTITWYTGHDLLNPSCWPQPTWTPTDDSFVAALTLDGWLEKPKCFTFLELCKVSNKCIFVRVVDTCAGCVKGSKHVDLTRAAFAELASLNEGILTVQMRRASEPNDWDVNLWGPRVK